jgi:hypothetical protein
MNEATISERLNLAGQRVAILEELRAENVEALARRALLVERAVALSDVVIEICDRIVACCDEAAAITVEVIAADSSGPVANL